MRIVEVLSPLAVVLLCGNAFAQTETAPATGAAPQAEAPTTTPPAETPAESTVTEKETIQASPDVQAQVGVGTEKEATQGAVATTPEPKGPLTPPKAEEPVDYGHFMQVGARGGISIPYKIMARFDSSPPCDQEVKDEEEEPKVCAIASSPALDLALSFAPIDAIEPYLWLRMGLADEKETNTKALRVFGAGARIYTMSDSMFKLFFEPALGIQTEGAIDPKLTPDAKYGTDVFVHLNFGGQLDFIRYAGIYVAVGPNVSFLRAITTTLEGNAGLQIRLP